MIVVEGDGNTGFCFVDMLESATESSLHLGGMVSGEALSHRRPKRSDAGNGTARDQRDHVSVGLQRRGCLGCDDSTAVDRYPRGSPQSGQQLSDAQGIPHGVKSGDPPLSGVVAAEHVSGQGAGHAPGRDDERVVGDLCAGGQLGLLRRGIDFKHGVGDDLDLRQRELDHLRRCLTERDSLDEHPRIGRLPGAGHQRHPDIVA